jgi:hypothetical protein
MVFYYLTPAQFGRYSSSNLCPPFPAWDGFASSELAEESPWLTRPSWAAIKPIRALSHYSQSYVIEVAVVRSADERQVWNNGPEQES